MIHLRINPLRTAHVPERPQRVVAAEIHQGAGAVLHRVRQPVEEVLARALSIPVRRGPRFRAPPHLAERSCIGLRLRGVIRRPPGHLVIGHHLDSVFLRQPLESQPRPCSRKRAAFQRSRGCFAARRPGRFPGGGCSRRRPRRYPAWSRPASSCSRYRSGRSSPAFFASAINSGSVSVMPTSFAGSPLIIRSRCPQTWE